MKATFVLTPAEARRLIAKAVIQMPEFQKAWKDAYVILAGGTTNAFIAQELLCDPSIEPGRCTVGLSCEGLLCVTEPLYVYLLQPVDKKIDEGPAGLPRRHRHPQGGQRLRPWKATWASSPAASTGHGAQLHRVHDLQGPEMDLPGGL